jgi:hypothetical protein
VWKRERRLNDSAEMIRQRTPPSKAKIRKKGFTSEWKYAK